MSRDEVRIGLVRLTDAAPVAYASARGLFASAGVRVEVLVEPSWANVADKLAWGLLEAAVVPAPLAIAMTLGLRGKPTRLLAPACLSRNGNAITLATPLARPLLAEGRAGIAARLRPLLPLRLAVVHAFSTHDLLLRLFLESGGIDVAKLAPFAVIPPADMPEALKDGRIDGFCAGAPWGAVAAQSGVGRTIAVSSAVAPNHPEKCLAIRSEWAEANPERLRAVLAALSRAAAVCDDPAQSPALAALLAAPEWVGVPAALIGASLPGGSGTEVDRSIFAGGPVTERDAAWLLAQMRRWRTLPPGAEAAVLQMFGSKPDF